MTPADLVVRLNDYLSLRRATGFAMQAEERLLRDFLRSVCATQETALAGQIAVNWARSTAAGPGGQARRLSVARRFLLYLSAFDPEVQVPERHLLQGAVRPKPHIYSETEIDALLRAASSLGPSGSLRPDTYKTLLGLMLSTGLRAGEAIHLRDHEVVLDVELPPRLRVMETKFRKSRLVPLHPSTAVALSRYRERRARLSSEVRPGAFFISLRGTPLKYRTVSGVFVDLARQVGLRGPVGTRGPTLHCLRHTFAVRRLLAWYRDGRDVQDYIPNLAVYLGHLRPEETYWYLSATPELLRAAATRFESQVDPGEAR